MSLVNVVKVSLAVAAAAAVGYIGYKVYKEEITPEKRKTAEAVKKSEADIAAAVVETERVRKACEESIAETDRQSIRDQEEHEAAMQDLYLKDLQLTKDNAEWEALWDRYQAGEMTSEEWIAETIAWRKRATQDSAFASERPKATVHDLRGKRKCS